MYVLKTTRWIFNRSSIMNKRSINRSIISMAILGILISTYALYVEMAADANPQYKAFCDLSPGVSCSKVLTSDFSKGFGIVAKGSLLEVPNCIYGILFYCLMIFMTTYDNVTMVHLQLITAMMSIVSCFYLAYLLIFVLHDLCIVCVSTYFVNFTLTILVNKKKDYVLKKDE